MGSAQLDAPWKFPWSRDGNHFLSAEIAPRCPPQASPFISFRKQFKQDLHMRLRQTWFV